MNENIEVNVVEWENQLRLQATTKLLEGEKININNNIGLSFIEGNDTKPLEGTFLVGELEKGSFTLWDNNRNKIEITGSYLNHQANTFSIYSLKGAQYFYFFAIMIAIVGIVFIYFAENYKGKTYIQQAKDVE